MCPHERYIINAAKSHQKIILAICVKKLDFKAVIENACGENLVPTAVPDICWLILKTVL